MMPLKISACMAVLCVLLVSIVLTVTMTVSKKNTVPVLPQPPVMTTAKLFRWSTDKSNLLNQVIDQAQSSGLEVETATLEKVRDETIAVNFVLHGNFMQLLNFIRASVEKRISLQVDALEITANQLRDEIKLKLTILNAQPAQQVESLKLHESASAWSENYFTNLLTDTQKNLSRFSINAAKYVGYLQVGTQTEGLILLPDGALRMVKLAERVGSESALITQLNDSALTFKVQDVTRTKHLI